MRMGVAPFLYIYYLFIGSDTFNAPEALECRGIGFAPDGTVVSRPLHKFFNVGEKEWLSLDAILQRDDIVGLYEKIDGSMIATAWHNGQLLWRSKQSFNSDVVKLTHALLEEPENQNIKHFAEVVASSGMTAIFELTHPDARIIVAHDAPALRLLHVRDNVSGQYVMMDDSHSIHALIEDYAVPVITRIEGLSLQDALSGLDDLMNQEGYVIQFANGDMAKIKCPWYRRLHGTVSMLRERDIALLAIDQKLDDVKAAMHELDMPLDEVTKIEDRVKEKLLSILEEVEAAYKENEGHDRKEFVVRVKGHPLFPLIMLRFTGQPFDITEWYKRTRLKDNFSLRVLIDQALADGLSG